MRSATSPGANRLAGLTVYAVILMGFAYACAGAEHGILLPWTFFFAPFSALSYAISWDGPATPMLITFFGVALAWPLAGFAIQLAPVARRRALTVAALLTHYASAVALVSAGLNRFQKATLRTPSMATLAGLGFAAYLAGQVVIWKRIRDSRGKA